MEKWFNNSVSHIDISKYIEGENEMKVIAITIVMLSLFVSPALAVYAVRISDLGNTLLPPNPIKVCGTVTSLTPMRIYDGTAELEITGLNAFLGEFVVLTGNYFEGRLNLTEPVVTTYYVSKGGSDSTGNGTSGKPFLTIKKALTEIAARGSDGDCINVGAGTFIESNGAYGLYISKSVSIVGAGIGKTTIECNGTAYGLFFGATSGSGQCLSDLSIRIGQSVIGGILGLADGGMSARMTRCEIYNNPRLDYVGYSSPRLMYLHSAGQGVSFTDCIFSNTTTSQWWGLTNKAVSATFTNCHGDITAPNWIAANYGTVTIDGGKWQIMCSGIVICFLHESLGIQNAEINLLGTTHYEFVSATGINGSLILKGNTITAQANNRALIDVVTGTWAVKIENNLVTCTNPNWSQDVIRVMNQSSCQIVGNTIDTLASTTTTAHIRVYSMGTAMTGVVVSSNLCKMKSSGSYGICVGTDDMGPGNDKLTDAIIENNTVLGAECWGGASTSTHSLMVGYAPGTIVRNNFVWGGGYGVVVKGGLNTDFGYEGGILSNVFVANRIQNIYFKGVKNIWTTDNVCYNPPGASNSAVCLGLSENPTNGSDSTGIKAIRNILVGPNKLICVDSGQSLANSDYNVLWQLPTVAVLCRNDTVNYLNMFAWQSAGHDANSIYADPLFVDAEHGDFRLQESSPAIDILAAGSGL